MIPLIRKTFIPVFILFFAFGCNLPESEVAGQSKEHVDIDTLYHEFLRETFGLSIDSLSKVFHLQPISLKEAKDNKLNELNEIGISLYRLHTRFFFECILLFDEKNNKFFLECNDRDYPSRGTTMGIKNHLLINSESWNIPSEIQRFLKTETDSFYLVRGNYQLDRMRIIEDFLNERFKYELIEDDDLRLLMDFFFRVSNKVIDEKELTDLFLREYHKLMSRDDVPEKVKKIILKHYQLRINEMIDVLFTQRDNWAFVYRTIKNMVFFIRVYYRDHNLDPANYDHLGKYSYRTEIKVINSLDHEVKYGYQAIY